MKQNETRVVTTVITDGTYCGHGAKEILVANRVVYVIPDGEQFCLLLLDDGRYDGVLLCMENSTISASTRGIG